MGWIIQLAGVGAITASGTTLVYFLLDRIELFSERTSERDVQDRVPVLVTAGLVSFGIGHAFMMVFDMVSDTILYCKCTEEIKRQEGLLDADARYAPESLDALIDQECPAMHRRSERKKNELLAE